MHDGFTNKYSFTLNRQPITLVPLTPKQVREDQLKLQRSNEKKREKERKAKIEKNGEKNIVQSVKEREYFGHSESKRGNIELHCKKK
jgi:hypothetical protein